MPRHSKLKRIPFSMKVAASVIVGTSGLTIFTSNVGAQTPISLTGWNYDVVAEINPSGPSINSFLESGNFAFAEDGLTVENSIGYNAATGQSFNQNPDPPIAGLPSDRSITSLATNTVTGTHTDFVLQSYSSNNVALMKGVANPVTLTLETPQRLSSLAILSTSTGTDFGQLQQIRVTLAFEGGGAPVQFLYNLNSWKFEPGWDNAYAPNRAIERIERVQTSQGSATMPLTPDTIYLSQQKWIMYEDDFGLSQYGQNLVKSITFEKVSGAYDANYAGVFAVSGVAQGGNLNEFFQGTSLADAANYRLPETSISNVPDVGDDVLLTTPSSDLTLNDGNLTFGSLNVTNSSPIDYTIANAGESVRTLTLGGEDSSNSIGGTADDLIYLGPTSRNLHILGSSNGHILELALGRAGNFNIADPTATLSISASISGVGFGVNKSGEGVLHLSGNNLYSGATNVNGGTLNAAASGALGGTSGVLINTGGTLLLSGTDLNRVKNSASLMIAEGGTLRMGDSNSVASEEFGTLTLSSGSILDFGALSGNFRATFASLSLPESGYATIINWNGLLTQGFGGDTDRLLFSTIPALMSTDAIRFDIGGTFHSARFVQLGGSGVYEVLPNQSLAPVPEPTTLFGCLALLSLALGGRRINRSRS